MLSTVAKILLKLLAAALLLVCFGAMVCYGLLWFFFLCDMGSQLDDPDGMLTWIFHGSLYLLFLGLTGIVMVIGYGLSRIEVMGPLTPETVITYRRGQVFLWLFHIVVIVISMIFLYANEVLQAIGVPLFWIGLGAWFLLLVLMTIVIVGDPAASGKKKVALLAALLFFMVPAAGVYALTGWRSSPAKT